MARARNNTKPPELSHDPRQYRLLAQVAKYYQRRFNEEPRARNYLTERGIKDKQALEVFGAGYCDGTLKEILPFDDQVHADLKALGIVKDNDKEFFAECVVFPLWSLSGACVGMYGRRLFASEVHHLYLPGPRRGLINWRAAKRDDELILAESVIDALSLYAAGVTSAVPCYGTGGFTSDHGEMLRHFAPKRLAICFDGDAPGCEGAAKLANELQSAAKGKTAVRVITLAADTDANDLLVAQGAEVLRSLVAASAAPRAVMPPTPPFAAAPAQPGPHATSAQVAGAVAPAFEKTAHGFALHVGGRRYEVKAYVRQGTQLRATLKASKSAEPARFELATIDLYSHRSREWFAGLCAALFAVEPSQTTADLAAALQHVERALGAAESTTTQPKVELTDRDREEALSLLRRPTLIHDILDAFETVGYAEEITNKQLGYLVAISRKLDRPLSLLIESRSSAGKSALQDAILSFVPEEEAKKYSRITDQALFYESEDALEHKLLVIEEATGMGGAVYSIRALQSGEELRVATTTKDPATGKMRTEENTVKAKTAVMMTTTNPSFDEETKSRFIRATVNESAELTRKILEVQRQADTIEGIALSRRAEKICRVHQNAQRLLKSVTVANPYAPRLTFPAQSIQARRDNKKYLGLIKAVTLLYQYQRETKHQSLYGESVVYLETTLADIAIANRIARVVLTAHHGDVTPQARQLFGLIRKMLLNGGGHEKESAAAFTRRRLREHTGWSDWQVRTHLDELVELEYLRVRQGVFGKEYIYEIGDTHLLEALPGFGLTEVDALEAALETNPRRGGRNGAAVATARPEAN